ncbi:MAG: PLP-dependent cysteine synthase family protein [Lachnospiraceae bacterium]|nr:PLP-dependent cysteine synthase family protein [Lachnospiraceae bacterium]
MSKIVKNIAELVGHTPLFEFVKYEENNELKAHLLGKLEYFNPSGSVKDRAALNMIKAAERDGLLHPGDTIVENTSGNTGIGLAAFAASRGYKLTVFLEPGQSAERQKMLRAYGANLQSMMDVPGVPEALANGTFTTQFYQDAIQSYCDAQDTPHYFINQLANLANPGVHYDTTGPEIWEDTDGKVDILVATSGTAGTITGLAKFFREKNPDIEIVAVQADPVSRPGGSENPQTIDGIAPFGDPGFPDGAKAPFIVGFDYDECIDVKGEDAYAIGREIAQTDGVFLGQSAAAALYAATIVAKRPENAGKNIVTMLADNGMKYLSTNMYPLDKAVL